MGKPEEVDEQKCPMCGQTSLSLMEEEIEVPFFGKTLLFSMTCTNCKYHKADVEAAEQKAPSKCSIDVSGEEDMKIRVVKSSQATVKIPYITTITPGPASNGYISNIEGILRRVKHQIEVAKESEEDKAAKKQAFKLIKKINRVFWGQEKLKIIIEDPSGNSAIISDKAKVDKLKVKNG